MIAYTTKGYKVAIDKLLHPVGDILPRHNHITWSGRVFVVDGNPYYDSYADWWLNGVAINHDFGDLICGE